jgi:chromosome segregation protein
VHLEQQSRRLRQLELDIDEIILHINENAENISEAEMIKEDAEQALSELLDKKLALEELSQQLQLQQQDSNVSVDQARKHLHRLHAQIESLKSS